MEETKETMLQSLIPYFLCLFISLGMSAFTIISKVCLEQGMSRYVLTVYGFGFGTITTTLLALLFERKNECKISKVICPHVFFLGLLRTTARVMLFAGLQYTSAAFTIAMVNLVPSMTFILAILCRMEKLDISKLSSRAKIAGTVVACGGAAVMTLYKGIDVLSFHSHLVHTHNNSKSKGSSDKNFVKGSLILVFHCLITAAFFILQARTVKKYPAPMKLTTLTGVSGTLIATIIAAITDHKASSWRLSGNMTLVAPLYNGIMVFGIIAYVETLVVKRRGPVFITSFRPLSTVFVAITGLFILGEGLHLGEILGATLIVIGLYAILWGKEVEKKKKKLVEPAISDQDHVVIKEEK